MKRTLFLLSAVVMLLTPSCDFMKSINPFGKKARQAEELRRQQEAFRVADSIRVANEKAESERARQAEQARIAEEEARRLSGYHIIVGSFLTPAYADAWLMHIKGFGYDARIVDMDGGRWHLVSAVSFPDVRSAYRALDGVQEKIDSEAWVYRKE